MLQSQALERENARLTREANKLYVDLLKAGERLEEQSKLHAVQIKEHEVHPAELGGSVERLSPGAYRTPHRNQQAA